MSNTNRHICTIPEDSADAAYGRAISRCTEANDGTFWIDNNEYATSVRFCPFCGAEAPMWRGKDASPEGVGEHIDTEGWLNAWGARHDV